MSSGQTEKRRVLVVDDDVGVRNALARYLEIRGFAVLAAGSVKEAREKLATTPVEVGIVDFNLPDGSGSEIVAPALAEGQISEAAYCITGLANCQNVVEAMRAGCKNVLEKPFNFRAIDALLIRPDTNADGIDEWRKRYAAGLVGQDPLFVKALATLRSIADTDSTLLITGESGSGKKRIARAAHDASARRDGPFVAINVAELSESMIEDELFGHIRGAFSGADVPRQGRIAAASGGTLFLDEVGDMPLRAQAKLLRVLQDRTVTPIGADRAVPVDLRVIAATHRDLEAMADAGNFRADLLFRLWVSSLALCPLRARASDVPVLSRHFIERANHQHGQRVVGLDRSADLLLAQHSWPGNVRELANLIERAVILKRKGKLSAGDLQLRVRPKSEAPRAT